MMGADQADLNTARNLFVLSVLCRVTEVDISPALGGGRSGARVFERGGAGLQRRVDDAGGERAGQRQVRMIASFGLVDQRPGDELGQVGSQRILVKPPRQRHDQTTLLACRDLQMPEPHESRDPDVAVGQAVTAPPGIGDPLVGGRLVARVQRQQRQGSSGHPLPARVTELAG